MEASQIKVIPTMMTYFRAAVREHVIQGAGSPTVVAFAQSRLPRSFKQAQAGTSGLKVDVELRWDDNSAFVIRPKQEGDVVLGSVKYKELTSGDKLDKAMYDCSALIRNDDTKQDIHVVEIEFDWTHGGARLKEKGVTYVLAETIPGHKIQLTAEPGKVYATAVPKVSAPA